MNEKIHRRRNPFLHIRKDVQTHLLLLFHPIAYASCHRLGSTWREALKMRRKSKTYKITQWQVKEAPYIKKTTKHYLPCQASVEVAKLDPLGVYAVALGSRLDNDDIVHAGLSVKSNFDVAPVDNGPKESVGITARTCAILLFMSSTSRSCCRSKAAHKSEFFYMGSYKMYNHH